MNHKIILGFLLVFLLGWTANTVVTSYLGPTTETVLVQAQPQQNLQEQDVQNKGLTETVVDDFNKIQNLFDAKKEERNKQSPGDWIKMDQIHVYNNRVVLDIKDPEWAIFTDTKSMDPVIDSESNAIEVVPKSYEDIQTGDIVAYKSKYADGIITHRVIETGFDNEGWYARIKGDNNDRVDPGKVRFDQIKRVVVAIIY